jgi:hypothetical protein
MTNPFRRGTIRGLMVAVLGLAVAWAGFIHVGRRQTFRSLAEHHLGEMAAMASVSKANGHHADMVEGKVPPDKIYPFLMPVTDTRALRQSEAEYARRADYHAALARKYRDAANRPWTSVEPDPPSP